MRTRWLMVGLCALIPTLAACGGGNNEGSDAGHVPQCRDGIDNDGDGLIDFPADPGCVSPDDDSEDSPTSPQCSDGRDNDGDGKIDYPNDPGCFSPEENSEVDDCPHGSDCPQCANGIDDDGNGLIDYPADPGCSSAADTLEFTDNTAICAGIDLKPLPADGSVDDVLGSGSVSNLATTCGGGGNAPAIAYEVHLTSPKVILATTDASDSSLDTVIDIRGSDCAGSDAEITCNDNTNPNDASVLTSTASADVPAGTYFIIVEGYDNTVSGAFHLDVSLLQGLGTTCGSDTDCGPGLVCRIQTGATALTCEKPECSDGIDNDGDGKIDYPNDPGCLTPDDNDETDDCPSGSDCPQCANGIDDDKDGKIDYPADPSCTSAACNSEFCTTQDPLLLITAATNQGDTTGKHDDYHPGCTQGTGGPDDIWELDIPALESLTVNAVGTDPNGFFEPVVAVLGATCAGTFLGCDDDTFDGGLTLGAQAAGQRFVVIDGDDNTEFGPYSLSVSGVIKGNASCDSPLVAAGALVCADGFACKPNTAGSNFCLPTQCNDGIDNDGDGKIDYPFDPGCSSPSDDSETIVCPGVDCPVCSNGSDDDGDGKIDYPADFGCSSAGGDSEVFCSAEQDPVVVITAPTTSSTFANMHEDETMDCGFSFDNDRAFSLQLDVPVTKLTIDTKTSANTDIVLELFDTQCDSPGLACADDEDEQVPTTLTLTDLSAGNYAVVAQTYDSFDSPTFKLNVAGTIAKGTACTSALFTAGVLKCASGSTCTSGKCE